MPEHRKERKLNKGTEHVGSGDEWIYGSKEIDLMYLQSLLSSIHVVMFMQQKQSDSNRRNTVEMPFASK